MSSRFFYYLFLFLSVHACVCVRAKAANRPGKRELPLSLIPFFPLPSLSVASIAFLPSLKWRIKPRGGAEKTLRRGRKGKGGERELCAQKIERFFFAANGTYW